MLVINPLSSVQSVECNLGGHTKATRDRTVIENSCRFVESRQRLVRQQHTCSDTIAPCLFTGSTKQPVAPRQRTMAEKQVSKLVHEGEVLCAIRFVATLTKIKGAMSS